VTLGISEALSTCFLYKATHNIKTTRHSSFQGILAVAESKAVRTSSKTTLSSGGNHVDGGAAHSSRRRSALIVSNIVSGKSELNVPFEGLVPSRPLCSRIRTLLCAIIVISPSGGDFKCFALQKSHFADGLIKQNRENACRSVIRY
jgi:hypothetical protein